MKTKTIFKTLAFVMLMPAMLLTTACSSDDDAVNNEINNNENTAGKGYALPVTINVTRGDATTRATYNEGTKTLAFSTGDKLFVAGTDATAGQFAGTLTWVSEGTFSGTIYTENSYTSTADALLGSASTATATLLPAGYGSIGYLTVSGDGYSATLATDATKAFATSKADGVAQLSLEQASTYDDGFELAPQNAILNFTAVTGQWGSAPASSSVSLQAGETTISGSVTPVEGDYSRALANFAIAVAGSASPSSLTLTVDGTSVSLGSHTLTAGKIYNQKCANINGISPYIQANEKWLVYGTGAPSGWTLTIAEGATVTLSNVNLNNYATITYLGNNTIILADGTTNTIDPGSGVAINGSMAGDKTLTITGTGTLIATGGYYAPAIGIESGSCGAITIANTVTLTATAGEGQSKAITTGSGGGTVTIGDDVYADGANSPFVYPAPAPSYTMAAAAMSADKGKLICADGHIHANGEDAECTKARLAKIIYIGDTGLATYSNGLALALTDEASTMLWQAAIDACSAKNTSTPVTNATWLQASKEQWNYMLGDDGAGSYTALRDGFSGISGASDLQSDYPYWSSTETSSTETEYQPGHAWFYLFGDGNLWGNGWYTGEEGHDSFWVRACLAF